MCHCEAAAEAINRHRILMILASRTVDCHARPTGSLAMTHPLTPLRKGGGQNPQKKRAQSYGEAIAQRRFGFCHL